MSQLITSTWPEAAASVSSFDALQARLNYHWLRDEILGCAPSPERAAPWARDFSGDATVTHYEDEPFISAYDAVTEDAADCATGTEAADEATDAAADTTADAAADTIADAAADEAADAATRLPKLASLAGTSTAAPLASDSELSGLEAPAASSKVPWLLRLSLTCAVLLVLCFLGLYLQPAFAADTGAGTALPYESWLSDFQKSLTGPVAFAISLIGIVVSGITLILGGGEIRGFARTMVYIVLVMTLLIGANSLMSNFFNGASIPLPENEATQESVVSKEQTDPAHVLKQRQETVFIPEIMALYNLDRPSFDSYQEVPWDEIARSLEEASFEGAVLIEAQEPSEYLPQQYHLAQR